MKKNILILTILLALFSCSSKKDSMFGNPYGSGTGSEFGTSTSGGMYDANGNPIIEGALYDADGNLIDSGEFSVSDLNSNRDARFNNGSIPTAEGEGFFRDIFFNYDSNSISDIARQNVEYNAQLLKANPQIKVQLEGHCDERGTNDYNMALGAKRAEAIYDLLINYGVPASSLETISYGEEIPLVQGSSEQAFAKNRRVHFSGFSQ